MDIWGYTSKNSCDIWDKCNDTGAKRHIRWIYMYLQMSIFREKKNYFT